MRMDRVREAACSPCRICWFFFATALGPTVLDFHKLAALRAFAGTTIRFCNSWQAKRDDQRSVNQHHSTTAPYIQREWAQRTARTACFFFSCSIFSLAVMSFASSRRRSRAISSSYARKSEF